MQTIGMAQRERVLLACHPHVKVLSGPVAALFVTSTLFGGGLGLMPRILPDSFPEGVVGIWVGLFALALLLLVVLPFLRWRATSYAVTNQRVIIRQGLLTRTGGDIPLSRVNAVRHSRTLLDRILGSGTLYLMPDFGSPLVLSNVPRVSQLHATLNDLLFLHRSGGADHLGMAPW